MPPGRLQQSHTNRLHVDSLARVPRRRDWLEECRIELLGNTDRFGDSRCSCGALDWPAARAMGA